MKTISTGKAFNELDSKELGKWGERVATNYIEKIGLTVVDTNYRTRLGEIDIIAKRDLVYHFIEIKARRGMQHGLAREAVTKKKQKHIKRAAMLFLYDLNQKKRRWKEISFDVFTRRLSKFYSLFTTVLLVRSVYVRKIIWSHLARH